MANRFYPNFFGHCMKAAVGGSFIDQPEEVKLFAYVTNASFGYNVNHKQVSEINPVGLGAKSKEIPYTVSDDGTISATAILDIFEEAEVVDMYGFILVFEWLDGVAEKSSLIAHIDQWDQSVIPVNTTEIVKLAFQDNFLLRLGNVGPA